MGDGQGVDDVLPLHGDGQAESCWWGWANGSMPRHIQVTCVRHGRVVAECTKQEDGGNCINTHPKASYPVNCPFTCPDHEWTDEELGVD